MLNLDIGLEWIIGGVVALVAVVGNFFRVRAARKEGMQEGIRKATEATKEADEKRATEIKERVDNVRAKQKEDRSTDNAAAPADGVPKPKSKRKPRGYRD